MLNTDGGKILLANKKKSKKNYKQYPVFNLEKGMLVLGSLISGVAVNLKKYKIYDQEVSALIKKYEYLSREGEEDILIPANEYDNINDKLLYRQREILKYIADCQKSSFSYLSFRKILVKNKLISTQLDEKISVILNDFLDIRNWTFHNPQSMMVATSEVAEKSVPKKWKGLVSITPQLNPIIISHASGYDFLMLLSLSWHNKKRSEQFELVLNQMKADYEEMYNQLEHKPLCLTKDIDTSKVVYYETQNPIRFVSSTTDVSQISMAIQKSKYDGSDEKYNEWAINKTDADTEIEKRQTDTD